MDKEPQTHEDTKENKVVRAFFAFLFSISIFLLFPLFVGGKHATPTETAKAYRFFLGSSHTMVANWFIFSVVLCLIAYHWYKLKIDRFIHCLNNMGELLAYFMLMAMTSGLLIFINYSVSFIYSLVSQ